MTIPHNEREMVRKNQMIFKFDWKKIKNEMFNFKQDKVKFLDNYKVEIIKMKFLKISKFISVMNVIFHLFIQCQVVKL